MAPEVIACDEQPDATYDNRVRLTVASHSPVVAFDMNWYLVIFYFQDSL